jgi:adenine-specific DNA-methyltransferase
MYITCPGGRVIDGPPGGSYWRVSEETLWEMDADHRIWWGEDGNNVPRIKRFLSEVQAGLIPQTLWDYSEVGHTQEAKQEYLQILSGSEVFTTPKPVALVKRILQIATSPGDLILDSFAGSGTTGHAVLEINGEDAGNRRFILVQIPYDTKDNEKQGFNICQKITYERVRRVIEGYTYTKRQAKGKFKKAKVDGLGGSLSYTRVGSRLFGEYREMGEKLPPYEELAKYIFWLVRRIHG